MLSFEDYTVLKLAQSRLSELSEDITKQGLTLLLELYIDELASNGNNLKYLRLTVYDHIINPKQLHYYVPLYISDVIMSA